MPMECKPTFTRAPEGIWVCYHPGTFSATGPTREAAYTAWVRRLNLPFPTQSDNIPPQEVQPKFR